MFLRETWKRNLFSAVSGTNTSATIGLTLREKCTYSVFFWYVFSRIWTGYGEVQSISPYSVRMWENTDQKFSEYGHFLSSVKYTVQMNSIYFSRTIHRMSWKLHTLWGMSIIAFITILFTQVSFFTLTKIITNVKNVIHFHAVYTGVLSFIFMELYRISYHRCFIKKMFFVRAGTITNFAKFTGKFTGLRSVTLLKTRISQVCFPVNFAKFLKAPLKNTSERLLLTLCFIRFFSTAILLSSQQFTDVKHHLSINKYCLDFEAVRVTSNITIKYSNSQLTLINSMAFNRRMNLSKSKSKQTSTESNKFAGIVKDNHHFTYISNL